MASMKYTVTVLPAIMLLFCVQVGFVESYVSYLPTATDENSAEAYDSFDQSEEQDQAIEDKLLYKLLNGVLMQKLRNVALAQNNGYYETSPDDSFIPESKRGLPGLEKMIKRKVFWQPIGFMPNKVNQSGGSSRGRNSQSSSQRQAGQPFRYG